MMMNRLISVFAACTVFILVFFTLSVKLLELVHGISVHMVHAQYLKGVRKMRSAVHPKISTDL